MDVDTLTNLLGKLSTDPQVEAALRRFGVARRPEFRIDPGDADGPVVESQDWVSNLSSGIEFGFQEEGAFMGADQRDQSVGPMILTEVYFYGERPGALPYSLPLPFGLSLNDSRSAVRAKMGPLERTRRSYIRDTWEHPAFRMTVSYADEGTRIDFVVCMLRSEAPEFFDNSKVPLPSFATMSKLLGKSVEDDIFWQTFIPLGLKRQKISHLSMSRSIDLRRLYGLILKFRKIQSSNNLLLLQEIIYLRAGELGSSRWRGELPFDIHFDDSPETVFDKVNHVPTHRDDQDFSGQAYWELPEYSLLVTYSTMENIVLRVSMFSRTDHNPQCH